MPLRDRILALDEAHEHYDDRDHEEKVQEAAERVGRYNAKKPEHEKDCCNRIKHGLRVNLVTPHTLRQKAWSIHEERRSRERLSFSCDEPSRARSQ